MPDADTLKKLARYFGVSIDNLLGESNSVSDEFTETLYRRPGMRILFDAAKDAPDEVLQKTADLLEAMKNGQVK
jgi:transcriptional regulator with XRE-family HTH domain